MQNSDPPPARAALVTGGSRGIGRAIAIELARHGCDVAVNYRRDVDAAKSTVAEIEAIGRRAVAVQASVAEPEEAFRMVAEAAEQLGGLSILVCNGGVASRGNAIVDTDVDEMTRLVHTHALGSFYVAKGSIPHLVQNPRSDIVMVSSVATDTFAARGGPYGMAKAAQEALAMTLSKELQSSGVHVNVVAPGLVVTDLGDRLARAMTGGVAADAAALDGRAPFGHVCRPDDVARVVRFLVSDDAGYISGVRIRIDGGGAKYVD